ncbi:MAG: 30S ribosomal protein S16 [Candidatus Jidaibacter sp.]|jgi:small subunit ribosomal protein S16|nr:30S ribosomal protein S16 [Candidatus Jidaibacter sp.]
MAVKIRLARRGAKKRPYYKVVVSDSRSPRDGKFIEIIGSYNPLLSNSDSNRIVIEAEKAKKWLETGAQPTDVVAKLFKKLNISL